MHVLKFGGSSVATTDSIKLVGAIIREKSEASQIIVVVSALGGTTDQLLGAAKAASSKSEDYKAIFQELSKRHFETLNALVYTGKAEVFQEIQQHFSHLETLLDGCFLLGECSSRTNDAIIAFGELLSSRIIAAYLAQIIPGTQWIDSRQLISTDNNFGRARVDFGITDGNIRDNFSQIQRKVSVLPGFIASASDGRTTTLGRGGSDYTAAILAAALDAEVLEIWTDVNGMYTADPRIVRQAQPIAKISYHEAMELSHFGAKVIYPPTIHPIHQRQIPILIKNTFEPVNFGTLITSETDVAENPVKGISHIESISLLTLEGSGMVGVAGSSKKLFGTLSNKQINVIFITQASSEHSICIGILDADSENAKASIDLAFENEIAQGKIEPCSIESNLSIIAVVGENMKNHQGLSGKMFSTLGRNNVNIRAIAQGASERNISAVIDGRDVRKALNSLHEAFFEEDVRQLNLYVMGVGNVGERFLNQVWQQRDYLREHLKLNLRVIGLANSRRMIFDGEGLNLEQWQNQLQSGEESDTFHFREKIRELNLRNSIFVDITASDLIASTYLDHLSRNTAVVTCNKIACSSAFEHYTELKKVSRKFNAPFLYETNVGAGLPIIDTLKLLVASGDKVNKIQAVLSGSLNFIFNNFNSDSSFLDVVKEAGVQGFTEPDPRIDLSGVDVARKILILIRESGYPIEMEEISIEPFLPDSSMKADDVPAFLESLKTNSAHFENLLAQAKSKNCRLKYVAQFENGKASAGLQFISPDHPFYNLEGKDNIVLFYTDRYANQPLIIKGAGAGADVTASGIFADVIRVGSNV